MTQAPTSTITDATGQPLAVGDTVTLKCISLHRPWADWVALGWKRIETRLHRRFAGLVGQRIGIHAAKTWDRKAFEAAWPWLGEDGPEGPRYDRGDDESCDGHILCTAHVSEFRKLTDADSAASLINCGSVERYGLVLTDVWPMPLCAETVATGRQGIFSVTLPTSLVAPPAGVEGGAK